MSTNTASPSYNRWTFDPTALPKGWLGCPRKSTIVANTFVAFKTPLNNQYKEKIDVRNRWTGAMLISAVESDQKKLSLIIDLTNTERYYRSDEEYEGKNFFYAKIRCRGHDEAPSDAQIEQFISLCNEFSSKNPDDIIGVHCTHGFNRTGFLICAYLCREHDMSIDAAIDLFSKARPPGIYKQVYLNELVRRYGDEDLTMITAPELPEWCSTNSDDDDDGNSGSKRPHNNNNNNNNDFNPLSKRPRQETPNANPQFAVSLLGVTPICIESIIVPLQVKCQQMCGWTRYGFPGSRPVRMDITNYKTIVQSPYMVSWKADGTRYMMLIEDKNKIYMFNRDNRVFEISHVYFPKDAEYTSHLTNTLVDGELVIDNVNGRKVPRYLIYDIIFYDNENVEKKSLRERLDIIRRLIIDVRNNAIIKGLINKTQEPFSIRNKDFWDLSAVEKLVGSKFQGQIAHEADGLIFQPEFDPYTTGRSPRVFKWKEVITIDFRLKIGVTTRIGVPPERQAFLFVNGMQEPFARIRYTPDLRQHDGKIIECLYRDGQWHFHRVRTDKSFPSAKATAFDTTESLQNPITKEMLCSLIDEYLNRNSIEK